MINVVSAKCLSCDKRSSFGFPDGKSRSCAAHKKDGMINLKRKYNGDTSQSNKRIKL